MKKILITLFFIVCSLSVLFATQISSVGYGKTQAEASDKAKLELAKQIFSTFIISETTVSENQTSSTNNASQYSESFSLETNSLQFGTLTQVKYENVSLTNSEKNKLGQYAVKAYITDDDATLNYYKKYLEDSKTNANYYYKKITSTENKHEINSLSSLISYYPDVLNSIIQYNSYAQILYSLGHNELVPTLDLIPGKTYNIISSEYYSILIEYDNLLRDSSYSASLTLSVMDVLNQNAKKIQELIDQKEKAYSLEQSQREALISAQIKKMSESLNTSAPANSSSNADFDADYNKLMEDVKSFNDAFNDYNNLVNGELNRITEDLNQEIKIIENRPYRLGQLDKYGQPLSQYKNERQNEINTLKQEKESEKKTVIAYIETNMKPVIQSLYEVIIKDLDSISSATYTATIYNGKLKAEVVSRGATDNDYSWTLKVSPDLPNIIRPEGQLNIRLSDLIDITKIRTNEDFLNNVDVYNELISNHFKDYFNLSIKFTVTFTGLNQLTISYREVKLSAYTNNQNSSEMTKNYRTYDFDIHTPDIKIASTKDINWIKTDSRISNVQTYKSAGITAIENSYSGNNSVNFSGSSNSKSGSSSGSSSSPYTNTTPSNPSPSNSNTPSYSDYPNYPTTPVDDPLAYQNSMSTFDFYAALSYTTTLKLNTKYHESLLEFGGKYVTKFANIGLYGLFGFNTETKDSAFLLGGGVSLEIPFGVSKKSLIRSTDALGVIQVGGFFSFNSNEVVNSRTLFVKVMAGVSYLDGYTVAGIDFRPFSDNKFNVVVSTSYSYSSI